MNKNFVLPLLLLSIMFLINCSKDENTLDSNLSPARKIAGTWKTTFPTTFYIKTDFCSANGTLELVASQKRNLTFVITEVQGNENLVDIKCTFTTSDFTVLNQNCTFGTGYVPDVSPMFLKGEISSALLTIKDYSGKVICKANFTTDLMEGTWDDSWCIAYCQEVYTDTDAVKLIRQ